MKRREIIIAGFGTLLLLQRPAGATPESMKAAIERFTGGKPARDGRVALDIAPLVDNGNVVPLAVQVDSPMTAENHVQRIAVFNEQNPFTEVALFELGPRCGRAAVGTRMRLATSQRVIALAKMNDGSCWQHGVDIVVTLAACIEGG